MIPLRDNIPPRSFAVVNYSIIAVCLAVFFSQLADSVDGVDLMVESLGMIPARVFHPDEAIPLEELRAGADTRRSETRNGRA